MHPFVPFNRPDVGEEEIAEVAAAVRSGWLTTGPETAAFERAFAEYTRCPHALAVNSCTAGLHLALAALDIGPGDEVITTPLTFCATVNVILEVGARPVLVDIGDDLNIDSGLVAGAVTPRTRAILPVHFAGLPCNMLRLWQLAREYGLEIVEDAAHSVGARYLGKPIGAGESAAAAFSFYATKNLTTGEGGMVATPSKALYDRMRILCLHGISHDAWNRYSERGSWHYEVVELGFKYNMSDVQAALGIPQLRKLDAMNARRARLAERYTAALGGMDEVETPPAGGPDRLHAWHLYVLRLNLDRLSIDRAEFIEQMRARRIGCSVHFVPIPLHPYYRSVLDRNQACSRALAEYPRLVSLPLFSGMSEEECDWVIQAVKDIVVRYKTRTHVSPLNVEVANAG